jgi:hypothetical protein
MGPFCSGRPTSAYTASFRASLRARSRHPLGVAHVRSCTVREPLQRLLACAPPLRASALPAVPLTSLHHTRTPLACWARARLLLGRAASTSCATCAFTRPCARARFRAPPRLPRTLRAPAVVHTRATSPAPARHQPARARRSGPLRALAWATTSPRVPARTRTAAALQLPRDPHACSRCCPLAPTPAACSARLRAGCRSPPATPAPARPAWACCGRTNLNYTGSSTRVLTEGLPRTSNGIKPLVCRVTSR